MSDFTADHVSMTEPKGPQLNKKPHAAGAIAFLVVLALGLGFTAFSINSDINAAGEGHAIATGAFVMLGIALLIALGFEFVNGFHVIRPTL